MKLGIDLDGCLVDFNSGYIDLLIKARGEDLFPPDRNDENFPPVWFYEREFGYGDVEGEVWGQIKESPLFWQNLKPLHNAREALQLLDVYTLLNVADVYFITHRSGRDVKGQSEEWLIRNGVYLPTVLIAGDKAPIIQALNLDFYIDDKPETITQLDGLKFPRHLYLKDAPYNRHVKLEYGKRIGSVAEALMEVMNGAL